MAQVGSGFPQSRLLFIALQISAALSLLLMNTRRKNQSAHPGIPDMTPSQLLSAGLSRTPNTRRTPGKRLTKDQQIAALKEELRAAQELMSRVSPLVLICIHDDALIAVSIFQSLSRSDERDDLDAGGDTDPATDPEETYATAGAKRKAKGSASSAPRYVLTDSHHRSVLYLIHYQVEAVTGNEPLRVVIDGSLWCHGACR